MGQIEYYRDEKDVFEPTSVLNRKPPASEVPDRERSKQAPRLPATIFFGLRKDLAP
jgi:hypothetical protein